MVVEQVWEQLAAAGLSTPVQQEGIVPHVTLALFADMDVGEAQRRLLPLVEAQPALPLSFQHLGLFTNPGLVAFVGPVVTAELLAFHASIHQALTGLSEALPAGIYYAPGLWVPHCSLAADFDAERLDDVLAICRSFPLPLESRAIALELIAFHPFQQVHRMAFPLPGSVT
jgi:2'-5' RNA ligase